MALSSDELIKREIKDFFAGVRPDLRLRIFPQSSRDDQKLFSEGGLTFGVDGVAYGSCDSAWLIEKKWIDGFDGRQVPFKPVLVLEATDALSRGSSGNAQYQRFHHALGAVRNGTLGVLYFRPGNDKIQPDLYGMAVRASQEESGNYIISDSLYEIKMLLVSYGTEKFQKLLSAKTEAMEDIFQKSLSERYGGSWDKFAQKRSTIQFSDRVVKYAGRNVRNFTESSQRAGHIALGEMYLTKYLFGPKEVLYLFPRMVSKDLKNLDNNKSTDKEWYLLRNEPRVRIVTASDIIGVDTIFLKRMKEIRDLPLKGEALRIYSTQVKRLHEALLSGKWLIS